MKTTEQPSKIDTVFIDLIREKNRNRLIVYAVSALCGVVSISALLFAYSVYKNETQTQYAVSQEGNVSKLEKVSTVSEAPEEALFHCQYMFNTYYTYSYTNVEQKREAGLWLIDNKDGINLEEKWKPWFNTVLFENLQQKAFTNIEDGNKEYFDFFTKSFKIKKLSDQVFIIEAACKFEVTNANYINVYDLVIKSKLRRVNRSFPKNPHGFVFFDYSDELVLVKENVSIE